MSFQEGDFVLIVAGDRKYLRRLTKDFSLNFKDKLLKLEHVLGKSAGQEVNGFCLLKPTLEDLILLGFERKTQIVYPKDSFYVAFKLGLSSQSRLLEFGVGSGASTAVFSSLAGEVWAYEVRQDFCKLAKKNWDKFGLCQNVRLENVDFKEAQVEEDFFDCAFVDVKDPAPYMEKVWRALKSGATFASLMPTANQVAQLLKVMEPLFCAVEVLEVLHRGYKANPERLRPQDTMVAHTGYLVFARKRT
ncbi:MAG: methyltransferase domain-containing protein [Aquificaceae bacterium]|nr:methyltransferase domain-containing protein [Aquificaceae bacterium]